MRMTERLHQAAAVAAVATGAGLLGTALGGLAGVDSELRAVTEAGAVDSRRVVQRTAYDPPEGPVYDGPRMYGGSRDCDPHATRPPEV